MKHTEKYYTGLAKELLSGAYDLHIHAAPDGFDRTVDCLEAAKDAAGLGMAGIVLKDHHFPTDGIAYLANKVVPKIKSFSSITISRCIGGFNAEAIARAAKRGVKIVWFPTLDASHFMAWLSKATHLDHLKDRDKDDDFKGYRVLDEKGSIIPEVIEILLLIKESDLVLSLGHLSPEETYAITKLGKTLGINKIKISHPQSSAGLDKNQQIELASLGAFMSYTFLNCLPGHGCLTIDDLVTMIRAVGPVQSILSSDAGQLSVPKPSDMLHHFVSSLLRKGFTPAEINLMIKRNPAFLLGL